MLDKLLTMSQKYTRARAHMHRLAALLSFHRVHKVTQCRYECVRPPPRKMGFGMFNQRHCQILLSLSIAAPYQSATGAATLSYMLSRPLLTVPQTLSVQAPSDRIVCSQLPSECRCVCVSSTHTSLLLVFPPYSSSLAVSRSALAVFFSDSILSSRPFL